MASLDGVNIFGYCVKMTRTNLPREAQNASAPGVNGVESTDLGLRGRVTHVRGRLIAASASALSSACQSAESFIDGQTHVLVDTEGVTWLNCKLESFAPIMESKRVDPYYGWTCLYDATIRHLT